MHGKLKIYFSILSIFQLLTKLIGVKRKKRILIYCKVLFHFHHISPVVEKILTDNNVDVFLLKSLYISTGSLPPIIQANAKLISDDLFKFINFDMTITLEYESIWMPGIGIKVFTPHGSGMKNTHAGNQRLLKYDVVFTIGANLEAAQRPFVNKNATIERIGFIINDQLYNKYNTLEKVENDIKTVLYAPSWSSNPEMVVMTEALLNELSEQNDFKVIFKPHPNLFIPDKCSGKDWNIIFSKLNKANLTIIKTTDFPIQKYMLDADVLLADISSVIFEYLYCDKPIVLQKNEDAIKYYQAEDMYTEISHAAFLFEEPSMAIDTIKYALSKPELHSTQRKEILHTKFFNIGKATEAAVSAIYKHLGLPQP